MTIQEKSLAFAIEIVKLCKEIDHNHKIWSLTDQLRRSGTSIGAMVREAQYAESKADFIHKMQIGQKETNETIYWLNLINSGEYIEKPEYTRLHDEAEQLLKMTIAILKTSKKNRTNH